MEGFKENRVKIAKIAAVVSTVCAVLGFICLSKGGAGTALNTMGSVFLSIQFIGVVISYALGGIVEALKTVWRIAKSGFYFLFPPVNLIAFLFTFILGIVVALYLPIIPVSKMQ